MTMKSNAHTKQVRTRWSTRPRCPNSRHLGSMLRNSNAGKVTSRETSPASRWRTSSRSPRCSLHRRYFGCSSSRASRRLRGSRSGGTCPRWCTCRAGTPATCGHVAIRPGSASNASVRCTRSRPDSRRRRSSGVGASTASMFRIVAGLFSIGSVSRFARPSSAILGTLYRVPLSLL